MSTQPDANGGALYKQRRLTLAMALFAALAGALAWMQMPRQEDPDFPYRNGMLIVPWPGADAAAVERLVVRPLEDALSEVESIHHINATARTGVAVVTIQLVDAVYETAEIWREVDDQIAEAQRSFPSGVIPPITDYKLTDIHAVVLGVVGSEDPLQLRAAAETLQEQLRARPGVARVKLIADPGRTIVVDFDDATARRYGVTAGQVAQQLERRSRRIPGGTVQLGERVLTIDPSNDYRNLDQLAQTPIRVGTPQTGTTVQLGEMASIRYEAESPVTSRMRVDGRRSVGLSIIPESGIDILAFGEDIRRTIAKANQTLAPLSVETLTFQPERVSDRLDELSGSLVQGIGIVAAVLLLFMGLRLGFVVSLVVPVVALSSLAIYAAAGGALHQISIAALVLSLGLLVDNAIVVAERVQYRIDRGEPPREAASASVRELFWPLAAATATTLASFVPLLLSVGPSGDFTRAIPVVVMLTLAVSFVFAVTFTPTAALLLFKRSRPRANAGPSRALQAFSRVPARHPWLVLAAVGLAIAGTMTLAPQVKMQFFPSGDRNQAVFEIEAPEGTHLERTNALAQKLERALSERPEVTSLSSYVGRSTPSFYYNLVRRPQAPHVAQMIVHTRTTGDVDSLLVWGRDWARTQVPGVTIIGRRLEQGPPVPAPIELRVHHPDPAKLADAVRSVRQVVERAAGTVDVRDDIDPGAPALTLDVQDETAAALGTSRPDMAVALLSHTLGLPAGSFRGAMSGDEPTPIRLRTGRGEFSNAQSLDGVDVQLPRGEALPLAALATPGVELRAAAIHRRDGRRLGRVYAQMLPGVGFNTVLAEVMPRVDALASDGGFEVEIGGAAEASAQANGAIGGGGPIAAMILILVLLAQFRSFRKVGIILLTVPLAATGVIPGLVLADQPFGFTSLLGVLALIGIVVNNAIILIDVVDMRRADGESIGDALAGGIQERLRPILLTTVTTVVGLVPLLLTESTLWPPLASAMISGLVASTALTTWVVPAAYRILFREPKPRREQEAPVASRGGRAAAVAATALVLALSPAVVMAAPPQPDALSLQQAMEVASSRPAARADRAEVAAGKARESRAFGEAWLPTLSAGAEVRARSTALGVDTPFGKLQQTDQVTGQLQVRLSQPLMQLDKQLHGVAVQRSGRRALEALNRRRSQSYQLQAAEAWLAIADIDAATAALSAYIDSLAAQKQRVGALVQAGRAIPSDATRVALALSLATDELRALRLRRTSARQQLAVQLGLDDAPEVVSALPTAAPTVTALATLKRRARRQRPELSQLSHLRQQLQAQRAAVDLSHAPSLALEGAVIWSSNEALAPNAWAEGAIVLRWSPFAGNQRDAARDEIGANNRALAARQRGLQQGIDAQVVAARNALINARRRLPVRTDAVTQAKQTVADVKAQFAAGRRTLVDVLEAETLLRDARRDVRLAEIDIVRRSVQLRFATGSPLVRSPQK